MLSTGSLLLLLLTLSKANDYGWGSYITVVGFIITGLLLIAFIVWESKFEFPLLPLHLFMDGTFLTAQIGMFLVVLGNSVIFFLMPFYIQDLKTTGSTRHPVQFLAKFPCKVRRYPR